MSTTAQREANRRNAQLSTGPTTPEGKQTASQNALKLGLTSRQLIIPGEFQSDYDTLEASLINDWQPANGQESALVQAIAVNYWRLQRVRRAEGNVLDTAINLEHREFNERTGRTNPITAASADTFLARGMTSAEAQLNNIRRYETTYERGWYRAINNLTKLQAIRRKLEKENGFVSQNQKASPKIGSVSQTDPKTITLETAPPEMQEAILRRATELAAAAPAVDINKGIGFVSQNGREIAPIS